MQDLDPEPERTGGPGWWRSSKIRELVLGLLLLCGVLGWSGYSWWRDGVNSSNYAQAQQARALDDWDNALAHYSAASGYKDADARAAEARSQVQKRDSQYSVAQGRGPAVAALLAARAVQTIEPGYKDIDTIARHTEDQVYTDALSGTVVMRAGASPRGLYYRGPVGWEYLKGSDQWSAIRSIAFGGEGAHRVVYDVPGPDWIPPAPLSKPLVDPYRANTPPASIDMFGRHLVLATFVGPTREARFEPLQLNPIDYQLYICGTAGVWGVSYGSPLYNQAIAKGILGTATLTYEPVFPSAIMSGTVTEVAMPGADGEVADVGHSSDSLLLAAHTSGAKKPIATELFIARADGSAPRLVFSTTGTLISAHLSPDDRHALAVESKALGGSNSSAGEKLLVASLLTLDGSVAPITLQKISGDNGDASPASPSARTGPLILSGVFLETGAFENGLLLGWSNETQSASMTVRLLDVSNPAAPLAETSVPYSPVGVLAVLEQPDGQTLLLYNQGVPLAPEPGKPLIEPVEILHANGSTGIVQTSSYSVPVPLNNTNAADTPYFFNPALRGGNLIYDLETYATMPESVTIYSLPLASTGSGQKTAQPLQIFTGRPTLDIGAMGVAGTGAYAYDDNSGILHAHLYDAALDVPLEADVGTIFALGEDYYSYKVLR